MPKLLSENDVAAYRDRGYHFPVDALSAGEVTDFRRRLEDYEAASGGPIKGEMRHRSHVLFAWINEMIRHPKILDAMEKGTQVEHIYHAARRLHAAGIQVGFFLQFGYPGETRPDIERTLQMVRDCRPDDIGMSVSYPMPGTRFFTAVQHELGSKQNWQDSDDLAMLYRGPFNTAFYRWLHKVLHREFRARRAWDELRPALSNPLRLRPRHLRLARSVLYSKLVLPLLRLELWRRARAPHQGLINLVPVDAATD